SHGPIVTSTQSLSAGYRQLVVTKRAKASHATAIQASHGRQRSQGGSSFRTEPHTAPITKRNCQASGLNNQVSPAGYTGKAHWNCCTHSQRAADAHKASVRERAISQRMAGSIASR